MASDSNTAPASVTFTLDGNSINAMPGETVLNAARRAGIEIPHLCYKDGLRADGNCRACVVEIEGERTLAASCCRTPTEGMVINSQTKRPRNAQKLVLELLKSDIGERDYTPNNELDHWLQALQVGNPRFPARQQPLSDHSHPAIAVNLDACIQCTRCLRACREIQVNNVIGYARRGSASTIVFDSEEALSNSSCVACGECVQACPTGALMPAKEAGKVETENQVDSICPYCGVGCQLTYHVDDNRICFVSGRDGPANKNRLCVKGRYGFDYIHHKHRLTVPLIRRDDAPKQATLALDHENPFAGFRVASWEEALSYAARGLRKLRDTQGPSALAGFGSAKGSNEEAYLFQKLIRTGFGTNNVDHCTRLCHASSVAALLEMIGSGAVSNPVEDVENAEVILIIGSNTTENHPVAATFIKNQVKAGKTLIVMDPRRTTIARHASHYLQFKPDTDVALLNAIMHAVIDEDLVDHAFIEQRTSGYQELEAHLRDFTPEVMASICGIDAETIRQMAKLYATSKASIILWGMGVSQHVHGTDNARALISLALMTGQIGRPGTGLHPLRGQNNVQGASDVGLIPMVFPDYQRVDKPEIRQKFEKLWQTSLDPKPGLTVVEIMHAITDQSIRGMYIMGENPAMSDPNLNHARKALATLQHLVVQDIFMTETAWYADVILPASAFAEKTGSFTNTDRRIQLGQQAIEPPGEARQDLEIIQEIANRMGLDWHYDHPKQVFDELRQAMPSIAGISWQRLQQNGAVTYPCADEDDPGQAVIFTDTFPTPSGKASFTPAPFTNADELPDQEYPWVLITGRQLEHWHTGAMTRRAAMLDKIEPVPVASLHPDELSRLAIAPGSRIKLQSRRGTVTAFARADHGMSKGQVFLPFCYHEAAANLLTNEALDPSAKIPEFKFCAIQVAAG
ncbi:MAG: formate dehydrogenase subunit alpha [Candidatus Thiodiazotropha lotti]|nr:formate dehydrogenase subunit alpha [Candidatus Thiodiazotropha lotti]MCG8005976.1 formate dehydrogenase subunit alpha [Candidatus Thiodiazotropha lotti]MCG8009962.1 formate dehydrogenase subunit alpha [Candidatus Thiodiazotropha lotti]MCW4189605.1 formate dehydrogenase subunit alpha [Candidatus Thiodiazotropha lotti]MCW4197556.1 formate dehydrogenase subunit alpha [Candidatus Thiodiazotropha lotti]